MADTMTRKQTEGELAQPESTRGGRVFVPNVDILEKDDEMLVLADVPGAKAQSIDITYEQGILSFHAKVEPRQAEGRTNFLLREYAVGDYHRSFRLGKEIDPAGIKAEIRDGVLALHLPKAEPARKKQIKVQQV